MQGFCGLENPEISSYIKSFLFEDATLQISDHDRSENVPVAYV